MSKCRNDSKYRDEEDECSQEYPTKGEKRKNSHAPSRDDEEFESEDEQPRRKKSSSSSRKRMKTQHEAHLEILVSQLQEQVKLEKAKKEALREQNMDYERRIVSYNAVLSSKAEKTDNSAFAKQVEKDASLIIKLENDIVNLKEENIQLQEELQSLEAGKQQSISEAHEEIRKLKVCPAQPVEGDLANKIKFYRQDNLRLSDEIITLKCRLQANESESQSNADEDKVDSETVSELKEKLERYEIRVKNMTDEINTVSEERDRLRERVLDYFREVDTLKTQLADSEMGSVQQEQQMQQHIVSMQQQSMMAMDLDVQQIQRQYGLQLQSLQSQLKLSEGIIASNRAAYDEMVVKYEDQMSQLRSETQNRLDEITASLTAEIEVLQATVREKEHKVELKQNEVRSILATARNFVRDHSDMLKKGYAQKNDYFDVGNVEEKVPFEAAN